MCGGGGGVVGKGWLDDGERTESTVGYIFIYAK